MIKELTLVVAIALTAGVSLLVIGSGADLRLGQGDAAGFLASVLVSDPWLLASFLAHLLPVISVHVVWFTLVWWITQSSSTGSSSGIRAASDLTIGWLSSSWLILRLNAHYFPYSDWTWVTSPLFQRAMAPALDLICVGALTVYFLRLVRKRVRSPTCAVTSCGPGTSDGFALWPWGGAVALVIGSATLNAIVLANPELAPTSIRYEGPATPNSRSNIIVLGLDSIRRDVITRPRDWGMPRLASLTERGFLNDNVVTPLARTYPAWVTILTGLHPVLSGARVNHAPQQAVRKEASIAWTFRQAGYRTVYATDETRFSHIDHEFGFDQVIGPQMGAIDFILGHIADQPLVNFLVQLPGAEYVLPALVGNRAFAHAYFPERFNGRLVSQLGDAGGRPTFLAIHLCTAHWPFFTAGTPLGDTDLSNQAHDLSDYRRSLQLLDAQIGKLEDALREANYLNDDSLLVVLSDHGEGLSSDSVLPMTVKNHGVPIEPEWPLGGHGSSLLAPQQWETFVLFVGSTPDGPILPGQTRELASLEDIAPKLISMAFENEGDTSAGFPRLGSRESVMMETGWRPNGFDPLDPDQAKAVEIAQSSYRMLPKGRLEMRPDIYSDAIARKSLGVTDGNRSLVYLEVKGEEMLVYADKRRASWDLFPVDGGQGEVIHPRLLAMACLHPEMKERMSRWCGHSSLPS